MGKIKSFFANIFTEPDNTTFCPVRIIGVLGTLQGLALSAYDIVIQHAHLDLQNFGVGLGVTLAALGTALGLKKDSAP